ncbi:Cell division cycle-associated protein 4 [Bagarius yarrelli]|uniref:Cell division cycle-associated protein 4 n=1 Tax=Bagarius yarrelli TaxID=175774 RepID=A0A556VCF7_BAGYA|nr:Cell division cycle-associated protein 4 [Bagarius yarrelli]
MGQREILSPNASMKHKAASVLKKEVEPEQKDALSSAGVSVVCAVEHGAVQPVLGAVGDEVFVCSSSVMDGWMKEEVEEPPTLEYGLGRGVKRKLSDGEEFAPDLPYPQQRQLVMDLCLNKLQSCQRGAELSLHRSVLLANTLRQIQQEMRLEGGDTPPTTSPASFPPPTPRHHPELPPVSVDSSFTLSGPRSTSPSLSEDGEDHGESRLSSPGETDTRTLDSLFSMFEITNSTSYLTDLQLDDIFEDIDTSMYDSSEISVLTFSAPREDGLKNLSNLHLCLADLSDLDHIMDILVRS